MQSITTTIRRAAIFGFAATIGLSAMTGVASAAPAAERGKGPEKTSTVTEDNDTNDDTKNNVVDDGDNAHPSGKDRSVEHGGSGNQGKAAHDPDDDGRGPDRSNGGLDQPGGAGGVDLHDQDGNNGCGNDDDFEDDNEGWCGKPEAQAPTAAVTPPVVPAAPVATAAVVQQEQVAVAATVAEVTPPAVASGVATEVLGVSIERSDVRPTEVLGVSHERGSLARTGFDLTSLALVAMALVAAGLGCKRVARRA